MNTHLNSSLSNGASTGGSSRALIAGSRCVRARVRTDIAPKALRCEGTSTPVARIVEACDSQRARRTGAEDERSWGGRNTLAWGLHTPSASPERSDCSTLAMPPILTHNAPFATRTVTTTGRMVAPATRSVAAAQPRCAGPSLPLPASLLGSRPAPCSRLAGRRLTRQLRTHSTQPATPAYEPRDGASPSSSVADAAASTWDAAQQPTTSSQFAPQVCALLCSCVAVWVGMASSRKTGSRVLRG